MASKVLSRNSFSPFDLSPYVPPHYCPAWNSFLNSFSHFFTILGTTRNVYSIFTKSIFGSSTLRGDLQNRIISEKLPQQNATRQLNPKVNQSSIDWLIRKLPHGALFPSLGTVLVIFAAAVTTLVRPGRAKRSNTSVMFSLREITTENPQQLNFGKEEKIFAKIKQKEREIKYHRPCATHTASGLVYDKEKPCNNFLQFS